MSDAYSRYVALLDDIECIPVAASETSRLSAEETAVVIARIMRFVRHRVLPQSDLEEERLEALLQGGVASAGGHTDVFQRTPDHDAIVEWIDELARVDPGDRVRVQSVLHRLYGTIAKHFGDAELMVAMGREDEPSGVIVAGWFG